MSLVTRCPACETAFKVVRDQLRLSEGWVRCGRCSQVFDATLYLRDEDDSEAPAPQASWPSDRGSPPAAPPPSSTPPVAEEGDAAEVSLSTAFAVPSAALPSAEPIAAGRSAPGPEVPPTEAKWPARDAMDLLPFSPQPPASPVASAPVGSDIAHQPPAVPLVDAPMLLPTELPSVVADEPWAITTSASESGSTAPQADEAPGAPSPVDQAVDAQLQKALRRTRIQALRASRLREREAEEAALRDSDKQKSARSASMKKKSPPEHPAVPLVREDTSAQGAPPQRTLRRASAEPAVEAAAPLREKAAPSFLNPAPAPAPTPAAAVARPFPSGVAVWVGVGLAVAVLMAQVLRHERDNLVARQPSLRPLLASLCAVTNCQLSAIRRIDAIRIDGSAFTPEQEAGNYRLLFSLRNSASTPLAMPAIELSLLDGNERPVVRRVFQPADFGAPAVLAARGEQSAALTMTLKRLDTGAEAPVVGYSMFAFYP